MKDKALFFLMAPFLLLVGFLFWPTIYRYEEETIEMGNTRISYLLRINRITGITERLLGKEWELINEGNGKSELPKPIGTKPKDEKFKADHEGLPREALVKLEAIGGFSHIGPSFLGRIYNGNAEWMINELTFRLVIKAKDDSIKSDRVYRDEVIIQPLSTESFDFDVNEVPERVSWEIIGALGQRVSQNPADGGRR